MKPISAPPPTRLQPAPPRARESLIQLISDLLRRSWLKVDATHYLDDYQSSEWLPPTALRQLQLAKLRRLVWHCLLHVPWWAKRLGGALSPTRVERLDGLSELPIARAEDRREAKSFVAAPKEPVGELRRTHGTRGAPHPVVVDVDSVERQKAVRLRSERWAGARPEKIVAVWGREALRAPRSLDGTELDALRLALGRMRGAIVSGPGPSLGELERALTGSLRGATSVIARGEDPAGGGARLAARLSAKLHRWYGAAEVGIIAATCERSSAAMHVHADHLLVEIVDELGYVLPPGALGRILITDLHNFAAPYLRHELGDVGRLLPSLCACGRALPLLEVAGRI